MIRPFSGSLGSRLGSHHFHPHDLGSNDHAHSVPDRDRHAEARCPIYIPATRYFVNAEPASLSEAGPSAT